MHLQAWTSRSQYLFENYFFFYLLHPTWPNFSEMSFSNEHFSCFEWKYCAVSQNVFFLCLLYIYTFPIVSFWFFVQWTVLGSKKPLQLTQSGYQETKIFGTKVCGGFWISIKTFANQQHYIAASYLPIL